MPSLYNAQLQKWETIPDSQVEQAVKTGIYSFPKSYSNIPMYNERGEKVRVAADDVYDSLTLNGYSYRTQEMREAEQEASIQESMRERLGGIEYVPQAFGMGALSGISSSLSDWGLRAVASDEELAEARAVQQLSPIASRVGEIVGTVGGVFSGVGPASVAMKTAGKLGLAGSKAGSLIGGKVGAQKAGAWLGQKAMEGAVADSLYEAGRISADLAYKDPNVTLQNAMARLGTAALTGAAFDLGLSAMGKALRGTATGLKQGVEKYAKETVQNEKVADVITSAFFIGKSPEQKKAFKYFLMNPDKATKGIRTIENPVGTYDEVLEGMRDLKKSSGDLSFTLKEMRDTAKKAQNFNKTELKSGDIATAKKTIQKGIAESLTLPKKRPLAYKGVEAQLDDVLNSTLQNINRAKTPSEMFDAIVEGRDYLWDLRTQAKAENKKSIAAVFSKAYNTYKNTLTDENLFGNYAKIYGNYNAPISNFMENYNKLFGSLQNNKKGLIGRKVTPYGSPQMEIDPNRIKSIITSPEKTALNREAWQTLNQLQQNVDVILKKANEPVTGIESPKLLEFRQKVNDNYSQFQKTKEFIDDLVTQRNAIILVSAAESKTGRSLQGSLLGGMAGATAGAVSGIPGIGLAGTALGTIFSNPMTFLKVSTGFRNAEKSTLEKLNSAAKSFFKTKPVQSTVYGVRREALSNFVEEFNDGEVDKKKKPAQNAIELIQRYNEDPNKIVNLVERSLPSTYDTELDEMKTASLNLMSNVMQYLGTKLPVASLSDQMFNKDVQLNEIQRMELEKYIDVAMNPGVIIEQIKKGSIDTVTVETVKNIYPEFYDTVRMEVLNQLTDPKTEVDYNKKLQLAILFDAPLTNDLQNIDMLQQFNQEFPGVEPEQAVSQAPLPTGPEFTRSQQLGA